MKYYALSSLMILALAMLGFAAQAQGIMAPGFYDNSAPFFSYYDVPTHETDTVGFYLETRTQSGNFSFVFIGSGFALWGQSDETSPPLEVCLSVSAVEYCETWATANLEGVYIQELGSLAGLPLGTYTVEIVANPEALPEFASTIYFDAVEVFSGEEIELPEVTATPDPTFYEWDIEAGEETQTVRFQYIMTTGDLMISIGLYGLLVLGAIGLVVSLWKK